MKAIADIRPSPIAGQWYPANAEQLAGHVDGYVDAAPAPALDGEEVVAVMVPHAGHRYSGPVAGHAFAALRGLQPEVVAVVSPMHYPTREPLLTSAHPAYGTPLGNIPVDGQALQALNDALQASLGIGLAAV